MTDKLWHANTEKPENHSWGICVKRPDGTRIYASCDYPIQENEKWAYLVDLHYAADRATVLQKKLDKAIQGFSQIIEIYRRAYEPWKESCNDMYDVALNAIKEIKDIKE